MFHNTHVYLATRLYKSYDNLLMLGAFLPDIAITKIIQWEGGLHGKKATLMFKKFTQKNPKYVTLYYRAFIFEK